jgi:hypothetical protein
VNKQGSAGEFDKMHAENYRRNSLQIYLPKNAFKWVIDVVILPTEYLYGWRLAVGG